MLGKFAITIAVLLMIAYVIVYYYYMHMLFKMIFGAALPVIIYIGAAIVIAVFLWRFIEERCN